MILNPDSEARFGISDPDMGLTFPVTRFFFHLYTSVMGKTFIQLNDIPADTGNIKKFEALSNTCTIIQRGVGYWRMPERVVCRPGSIGRGFQTSERLARNAASRKLLNM